jgi:hypothetical protein
MIKQIPSTLKKYFWDCDFNELSLENHRTFIVERLLMFGNTRDIQWILSKIPLEIFKNIIHKSRRLDNKTRNFWEFYFDHGGNKISYFTQ